MIPFSLAKIGKVIGKKLYILCYCCPFFLPPGDNYGSAGAVPLSLFLPVHPHTCICPSRKHVQSFLHECGGLVPGLKFMGAQVSYIKWPAFAQNLCTFSYTYKVIMYIIYKIRAYLLLLLLLLLFCSSGDRTQHLAHARQSLCHSAAPPALLHTFESSLDYLQYLIQCKVCENSCLLYYIV
jgi:hypothetical protein